MIKKSNDSSLWAVSYLMASGKQRMISYRRAIMNDNDGICMEAWNMHGNEVDTLIECSEHCAVNIHLHPGLYRKPGGKGLCSKFTQILPPL